jgi:uncharacterized membrane protein YgcG
MVRARVGREHAAVGTRSLPRRAGSVSPASLTPDGVVGLQRSIGNRAVTRLLQRVPTARVTQHAMSTVRLPGGKPAEKAEAFATLRAKHTEDAHAILRDLSLGDWSGGMKSDVTGTGDEHDVRIDRQNPTANGTNIQIQTNGKVSITIATVLVRDSVDREAPGAVLNAVRAAFRNSLADGMQWEVTDVPAEEKEPVYVKGGGKGGGKWDKKGGGGGKKGGGGGKKGGGGQGGGGRAVAVQ